MNLFPVMCNPNKKKKLNQTKQSLTVHKTEGDANIYIASSLGHALAL
jgi:hypothetical protein